MRTLLIVNDEEDFLLEQIVQDIFPGDIACSIKLKIVSGVDSAIEQLKQNDYPLILSGTFPAEPEEGMNVLDLISDLGVLRLLEFCERHRPSAKVCVISIFVTILPEQEEMLRAYPCVAEVLGKWFSGRKEKKLRKLIEKVLLQPAQRED